MYDYDEEFCKREKKYKDINELFMIALDMRNRAYAPVTGIKFGAAFLTRDEQYFVGANIEDWSLTLTRHAEMVAIDEMVINEYGEKIIDILVVVGDPTSLNFTKPIYPCGLCRQYISQFADDDTIIAAGDLKGHIEITTLGKLLTERPFRNMKKETKTK